MLVRKHVFFVNKLVKLSRICTGYLIAYGGLVVDGLFSLLELSSKHRPLFVGLVELAASFISSARHVNVLLVQPVLLRHDLAELAL